MSKAAAEAREALLADDGGDEGFEQDIEPGVDTGEDTGDDAGQDEGLDNAAEGDEGGEAEGEQQESDGEWTPPSREDWEAMQDRLMMLEDLSGPALEQMLAEQGGEESASAPIPQDKLAELMTPKKFGLTPEDRKAILEDGDGDALDAAFGRFAEVQQHNNRIDMNKAVLNGLKYAMPIMTATGKFYERHPYMAGLRELVDKHAWDIRARVPEANELQILRMVEKRLQPVIDRAKKHADQAKGTPKRTNLAATPSGGGQSPAPRPRTNGAGGRSKPTTTASRLEELNEFAGANRY